MSKEFKTFEKDVYIKVPMKVQLDLEVFDEDYIEAFSQYIHKINSLDELANYIALNMVIGENTDIDYVGIPLQNSAKPWGVEEDAVNKSVNVEMPYFTYGNRVIGDVFLEEAFEDCNY